MTIKVAINGFGRIGRTVVRELVKAERNGKKSNIEVVAINDLTDPNTLAHLLQYDSVHGKFPYEVSVDENSIRYGSSTIQITSQKDPKSLPWKSLGIDLVMECTGIFTKRDGAAMHLEAGAKKVLISAPATDPDLTLAFGVNHTDYKLAEHNIVSCASCTTNCLAPVAKVILENFGITSGTMTTIHSYTNDQNILDLPHKDLRRARAAAMSMIPTTTGAAKAVGLVLPALKGKVDGFAIRVPTPDVSVVDFVAVVERDTSVDEVNRALKNAADNSLKGILEYCDKPLVSVDFLGNPHSSIVDSQSTMVVGKRLVKVIAWYDNEVGFSNRMIDVASLMVKGS